MVFHYLIEQICHRNKYSICTAFVCTHTVGRGRDKEFSFSFLTRCLVTLSGYDRACTCLSSSSCSAPLPLWLFFSPWIGVNQTPCSGRGCGVAHVRTKRAKGYWLHISMNSSGLARLEASGGLGSSDQQGAVISLVTAVSWQPEWRERGREKTVKRKEWEADFEFPAVSTRGCGGDNILTSQNDAMAVFPYTNGCSSLCHYLKCSMCIKGCLRCSCPGIIQYLFHCLSLCSM